MPNLEVLLSWYTINGTLSPKPLSKLQELHVSFAAKNFGELISSLLSCCPTLSHLAVSDERLMVPRVTVAGILFSILFADAGSQLRLKSLRTDRITIVSGDFRHVVNYHQDLEILNFRKVPVHFLPNRTFSIAPICQILNEKKIFLKHFCYEDNSGLPPTLCLYSSGLKNSTWAAT